MPVLLLRQLRSSAVVVWVSRIGALMTQLIDRDRGVRQCLNPDRVDAVTFHRPPPVAH